jgi:hypothetical protein
MCMSAMAQRRRRTGRGPLAQIEFVCCRCAARSFVPGTAVTIALCVLGGVLFVLEPFGFGIVGVPMIAAPLIARHRNPLMPQSTSISGARQAV